MREFNKNTYYVYITVLTVGAKCPFTEDDMDTIITECQDDQNELQRYFGIVKITEMTPNIIGDDLN